MKEKITFKRQVKYIVAQSILMGLCFSSVYGGDSGLDYNLYAFWIVIEAILHFFIVISDKATKEVLKLGHTFGATFDNFLEAVQMVALAAVGWYWLAGCKLVTLAITSYIDNLPEAKEKV